MADNILITQGTRPFAQRVAKLLPPPQTVLFGSAHEIPQVLLHMGKYLRIPDVTAPAFVHEVLKICLDRDIDTLIPLGEHELYPMAEARQLFSEYGISVWVPDVAELRELAVVENPPRELPLLLLNDGIAAEPRGCERYGTLSGIFTRSVHDERLVLCCIAD